MPTTETRRTSALLTALAVGSLLFGASHPSQAGAPVPPKTQAQSPALSTPPGAATVVFKIGRALLEESDAPRNLRTETYRDEIEMASAAPVKPGPAKG